LPRNARQRHRQEKIIFSSPIVLYSWDIVADALVRQGIAQKQDTIEETLKIQEEGKAKRKAAEAELARMEGELKARLTTIKGA